MPTRLWDVRSALVAILAAAVEDIDGVVVFDGPRTRGGTPKQFLLVGSDGGEDGYGDGIDDGASADQGRSRMATNLLDEIGEVVCSAWAWAGDPVFAPLRLQVAEVVDACEAALRADDKLGGLLGQGSRATFGGLRIRETQTDKGPFVRAVFTITYEALIP